MKGWWGRIKLGWILHVAVSICKHITDKTYNLMRKAASSLKPPWIHTHPAQRLVCRQNRWTLSHTHRVQRPSHSYSGQAALPFLCSLAGWALSLQPQPYLSWWAHAAHTGKSSECLALEARGDHTSGLHRKKLLLNRTTPSGLETVDASPEFIGNPRETGKWRQRNMLQLKEQGKTPGKLP